MAETYTTRQQSMKGEDYGKCSFTLPYELLLHQLPERDGDAIMLSSPGSCLSEDATVVDSSSGVSKHTYIYTMMTVNVLSCELQELFCCKTVCGLSRNVKNQQAEESLHYGSLISY